MKQSTAAFQRLQRQHDREQPSTSVTRIPENHKTLSSGSGQNELSSNDFSVFNVKYDCSKASHHFTGLSLEGNKGSYKEVLEYSGRSTDPSLMKTGDFLLSIDGNDVKNMSMCGLAAFLKKSNGVWQKTCGQIIYAVITAIFQYIQGNAFARAG